MSASILNLARARKAKARDEKAVQAVANRVAYGRTGDEKKAARTEAQRRERTLDGAKLDG